MNKALNAVVGAIAGFLLLGIPLGLVNIFASVGASGEKSMAWVVGGAVLGALIGLVAASLGKTFRYVFLTGALVILVAPLASCFGAASLAEKQGANGRGRRGHWLDVRGFFRFFRCGDLSCCRLVDWAR